MIKFQCECGRKIAAPDQWLGKRVKCPQCGKPVLVQEGPVVAPVSRPEPPSPFDSDTHAESRNGADSDSASESHFGSAAQATHRSAFDSTAGEEVEDEEHGAEHDRDEEPAPATPSVKTPAGPVYVPPTNPLAQYPDEASWATMPRLLGALALIAAIAGAAIYWASNLEVYYVPAVAGAGLLLALGGVILSLRRERLGLLLPALAVVICAAACGLPWLAPLAVGTHAQPISRTAPAPPRDKEEAANEARRRSVLSVDSVQIAGDTHGTAADVEYKLTNKGSKPIKAVNGSIQLYDKEHKLLGGLSLESHFDTAPLAPGSSTSGKNRWTMDPQMQAPLANKQTTAEYRAEAVVYADGSIEAFNK
jgi:hypothetical protein